eukprot:TRINITY_DN845_c0_g3_i1.p1 TRINITY_DN845_c0_g3~~TRINITY_DN845_c0_g3_i1.p1  ORF type:complete len:438 (+),score=43.98 TRINITY_DN845_c0_g3_i1:498-1811(+)
MSQITKKKLLCLDALNFSGIFGGLTNKRRTNWPALWKINVRVKRFVQKANVDFHLVVFIDYGYETEETLNKWRTRREKEVKNRTRAIYPGFNFIIGEYFKRNNVDVHFSYGADNDDTIVSYAYANSGGVLSSDSDMFRYTLNGSPLDVTIYSNFLESNGKITLHEKPRTNGPSRAKPREVIVPPPQTVNQMLDYQLILRKNPKIVYKSSPSPLTRDLGNIHVAFTPLRQAAYYRANLRMPITEKYPDWNEESQSVVWYEQTVTPDPKYLYLLDDPKKALDTFPDIRKPAIEPPADLLKNHMTARKIVLCEIISSGTGTPILSLFEKHFPEIILPNHPQSPYTLSEDTLYVFNLPTKVKKSVLDGLFKEFHPSRVRIISDPNGRNQGYAFVFFNNKKDFNRALNKKDYYIGDVRIFVQPKRVPINEASEEKIEPVKNE